MSETLPEDHAARASPGLQASDLVNMNVPYEEDYKHHYSRWETYRLTDYYPPVPVREGVDRALRLLPALTGAATSIAGYFTDLLPSPWDLVLLIAINLIGLGITALLLLEYEEKSDDQRTGQAVLGRTNRRVRQIWPGYGQVQFGCGPKGISVEHQGGFLYLLKWQKVDVIYESEDPQGRRFGSVGDLRHQRPQAVEIDVEDELKFGGAPHASHNCGLLTEEDKGEILRRLRILPSRPDGWARKSIRVRLYLGKGAVLLDELVIPKRWFGAGRGDQTWQRFFETCWKYKFAAEHADHHGGGDAAITILPQHTIDSMVRRAVEAQTEGVVESRPRHAGKRAALLRSRGV
jgi:hypothetical protein